MTVEELREKLKDCAPNATVTMYNKHGDCWAEVVKVKSDGEFVSLEG